MREISRYHSRSRSFSLCMAVVLVCVLLGVLSAFKAAGGIFSDAADLIADITFEQTSFGQSFRRAATSHMMFCLGVLVFCAGFPVSVLPGAYILVKGFFLGVAAGLAAKCCVTGDAAGIFFALFISNVMILPLYILLFLKAFRFSIEASSAEASDRLRRYMAFAAKVLIFFALMCVVEAVQTGTGVLILK